MSRYWLLLTFICLSLVACAPAVVEVAESTPVVVEETHDDEHEQEVAQDESHEMDNDEDHDADHDEDGEEHREHGAHEHGAAVLTVAWSGSDMEVALDTPAFNLFGFEYEPSTDEELEIVSSAVADLKSGDLLGFNADADCQLAGAEVETAWGHEGEHEEEHEDADHDEEAEHEHEEGETHSDVEVFLNLVCSSPEVIRSLDLAPLFERFPNLASLEAQWVSDVTQSAAELSAESSLLSFEQ